MRTLLILFFCFVSVSGLAQTLIPDPAFEDALINLGIDPNPIRDGAVPTASITNITFLNLTGVTTFQESLTAPGLGITDLTGIKDFTSLEVLWVQQNDLTVLDLEDMTTITDVRAFFNDLEQLNIQGLSNLEIIGLNVNNLSGINVSTNTALRVFDVAQNNLLGLDISGLTNLTGMNVENNPQLTCIQVESAARAISLNNNGAFRKNGTTSFSNLCSPIYTQIPDRNFEQALIDIGYDTEGGIPNGLALTSDINIRTTLIVPSQGIQDLTGLEDFTSLEILDVSNNNLNALRLQNLSLIEIYANNTNVSGSEIFFQNVASGLPLSNVTTLELTNNNLGNASSNFSFGGVLNVQTLNISGNNFGTLTVGGETENITNLIAANCPNLNTLTGLNTLTQLQELTINDSNFTNLNFSGLDILSTLRINNNDFSSLNLKPIDDTLTTLNATANANLRCIEVNNTANAEAQGGWQKDGATEYLVDCNAPQSFEVFASIGGDVIDTSALVCCPEYEITEGQRLEINFNADPTAPLAEAYIVRASFSGDADANDFSVRESAANQEYTYSVKTTDPDNILQIDILNENDGAIETDEVLQITLTPVGANFTLADPQVFEVTIKPANTPAPFEVTANIQGATGTSPNFEITEGNSFTLNFESSTTATDGTQYTPNIQITLNGNNTTEDFNFNGNTALPITPFTVGPTNPDGSITILALEDTTAEPEETYTIALSSADPSLFIMTGQTNFDVTVNDRAVPNITFGVTTSLENAQGFDPYYKVNEGGQLNLIIDADDRAAPFTSYRVRVAIKTFKIEDIEADPIESIEREDNKRIAQEWGDVQLQDADEFDIKDYILAADPVGIDASIQLDIIEDSEFEDTEELIVYIELLDNNLEAINTLIYIVKIIDNDIEEIRPVIANAGNAPNYIVQEGQSFTLSLDPSGENIRYNTNLGGTATQNLDYAITEQGEFSINTLTFNTVLDGLEEDDETVILELLPFDGAAVWNVADSIGRRIIEITVRDAPLNQPLPVYTIYLTKISEGVRNPVDTLPVVLNEGEEIEVSWESNENGSIEKGLLISTIELDANFNDFDRPEEANTPLIFNGNGSMTFTISDDELTENTETFSLDITPTTANYNLIDINGEVIPLNEKFTIPIEIIDDDDEGTSSIQGITSNVVNATKNESSDPFLHSYITQKGEVIEIFLDGLDNNNDNNTYTLEYQVLANSTLTEADYSVSIENENGQDLRLANNEFGLTVNKENTYDVKITISISENNSEEKLQKLYLTLFPDVIITGGLMDPIQRDVKAYFQNASASSIFTGESQPNGNKLNFEFLIVEDAVEGVVSTKLSNTGGIEGNDSPDVFTCELLNSNGTAYNQHTSTIRIPTKVDYNVSAFPINEWELSWENTEFVFPPGESKATIGVRYLDEREANGDPRSDDIDCNYYYLKLENPIVGANSELSINTGVNDYLVKVVDKSDYLVFVDIDLTNVYPVTDDQEGESDYEECDQCISKYIIEEGKDVKFTLDAANGVDVFGNNTGNTNDQAYYLLNLITSSKSGKSFSLNRDARWDFGDVAPRKITIKDTVDIAFTLSINDDGEPDPFEEFSVSFNELDTEKNYRFSKKDSRSYDKTFNFIIVEPLIVNVRTSLNKNSLSEANIDIEGEMIISLNKSPTYDIPITFELAGNTRRGVNFDYILQSDNKIIFNGNKGIIYFKEGQREASLTFTARDDDEDEDFEENIELVIKNDFGYRGGSNQTATITIEDDDSSRYTVSIQSNRESVSENPNNNEQTARITFLLDDLNTPEIGDINDTEEDIIIKFDFLDQAPMADFGVDFLLYEELEGNQLREISVNDLFVSIAPGEKESSIILEVQPDEYNNEGNERTVIAIATGENYSPSINTDQNRVTIFISDLIANEPNNLNTVTATVLSSSCVGENNGRIAMTNDTSYNYNVFLYDSSKNQVGTFSLGTPVSDATVAFPKLAPGEYTVALNYDLANNQVRPAEEPPSFLLTIIDEAQVKVLGSSVNKEFKEVSFTVEGSTFYKVKVNELDFTFEVENNNPQTLKIPLGYGKNTIEIQGEANCQKSIIQTVQLNNVIPYPNPTTETIYISGFEPENSIILELFDLTGKKVLKSKQSLNGGTFSLNLEGISKGVYILKTIQNDGSINQFKISKK